MDIEILDNPEKELTDYLTDRIREFNWANWEVQERLPLAAQIKNESGEVIAGASARTFGDWLLLDILWVSEQLRGQNVGTQLLNKIEMAARKRGCKKMLVRYIKLSSDAIL